MLGTSLNTSRPFACFCEIIASSSSWLPCCTWSLPSLPWAGYTRSCTKGALLGACTIAEIIKMNCNCMVAFLAELVWFVLCISGHHGSPYQSAKWDVCYEHNSANSQLEAHWAQVYCPRHYYWSDYNVWTWSRCWMLETALYTGIRIARLYRFQGIRNRLLIPQIPLFSYYTGIIPV
jgi:hypothetical protein